MEVFFALLPLILTLALLWWGFRKFKSAHGPEVPGPQGQKPYGVHGILAFFIFASYYIAPWFVLAMVNANFMKAEETYPLLIGYPGYSSYKLLTFALTIVLIGWQIYVARRLRWEFTPSSLKGARILSTSTPFIYIFGDMILSKMTMDITPGKESIEGSIRAIMSGAIWIGYFWLSKRCKNTYLLEVKVPAVQETSASQFFVPQVTALAPRPAISDSDHDIAWRLKKLQELLDAGLLSTQEYESKRAEILSAL